MCRENVGQIWLVRACECGCRYSAAALWLSDCRVVGHHLKFGVRHQIGSYHPRATGRKSSSSMRRSRHSIIFWQQLPNTVTYFHVDYIQFRPHDLFNNKIIKKNTRFVYVGNNFSWSCKSLDFCHSNLMLFCNSEHFLTTLIAASTTAISWKQETETTHTLSPSCSYPAVCDNEHTLTL